MESGRGNGIAMCSREVMNMSEMAPPNHEVDPYLARLSPSQGYRGERAGEAAVAELLVEGQSIWVPGMLTGRCVSVMPRCGRPTGLRKAQPGSAVEEGDDRNRCNEERY